jgi:hypothetical protein
MFLIRISLNVLGAQIPELIMKRSPHNNGQSRESAVSDFVLWGYYCTSPPPPPSQLV